MRQITIKDGKPRFTADEFLSADQVKSFWSRMAQKQYHEIPQTSAAEETRIEVEPEHFETVEQIIVEDNEVEQEDDEWLEDSLFNNAADEIFNDIKAGDTDIIIET